MRKYIAWTIGFSLVIVLALIPLAYDVFSFLPPGLINNYTLHVLIIGFFYAMLASSWSLLMGYAGQFSFAHMAFAGIGAYTTGLMGRYLATNAVIGIISGTLMAGLFGLIIGMLVLRLRKTYLALFTIAFAEILRLILSAEKDYTEGPNGLPVEPLFPNGLNLGIYHFSRVDVIPPYYVMLVLLLITLALMSWLAASRFGLFLKAIREDEEAAAALGVDVVRYKILVFVITSMAAGLAGAARAHYVTVIAPNDMIILWMSIVITMSVLGGIESLVASAIGGIVIFWALEYLRSNFPLSSITSVIIIVLLTIIIFQLARYTARRYFGPLKGAFNAAVGLVSFILSLLIAQLTAEPVTTLISYAYYDITGHLPPGTVDMSAWRLVFFGLVLMFTLRFYQNGLLYPLMQYFFRSGEMAETVAKRDAASGLAEVEASL
ncbi:MAG: branched-chain amino acid ABC transporter permease [Anaerolineae bacterium]|nr:branched-chain amino acid ABC transporter permease [Anaerolineae bacterium]